MTDRVRVTFWVLVMVAVVATGLISRSIDRGNGLDFVVAAVGAIIAMAAVLLALRILVVTARHGKDSA